MTGHFEKGRWVNDEPIGCIRFIAPDGGIPMKSGDVGRLEISITQDIKTGMILDASCVHSIIDEDTIGEVLSIDDDTATIRDIKTGEIVKTSAWYQETK
jgi:hypothetical protein